MPIPSTTLEAHFEFQQLVSFVWIANECLLIGGLFFFARSALGRRFLEKISIVCKRQFLASFLFYFTILLILKLSQLFVTYPLLVKKSKLVSSSAPSIFDYLASQASGILVSVLLLALLGMLVIFVLRKTSALTWLWSSVAITLIGSAAMLLQPYVRNTVPLGSSADEQKIVRQLQRVGISSDQIALEDCEQQDCPPGQVIGLGPTKLIIFDRRLTKRTPEHQLLQVAAHEAKHFVIDNDLKPMVALFFASCIIFGITQFLLRLGRSSNNDSLANARIVLEAYAFAWLVFLLIQPVMVTWRQNLELEADRFGLELNQNNQALEEIMWADVAQDPMAYRYTIVTRFFRATHPQIKDRILLAQSYRPWTEKKPLKYDSYFTN
jgi:Zn-dependent protease with chaperone function